MYILIAILGFSLLIIVHEFGHFIMAKANKVQVEEFSIGMGPTLFCKKFKGTDYLIKLFPFGGYVKLLGDEDPNNSENSFSTKSPLQRLSIILAGAVMNIFLAIFLFSIVISNRGFNELTISKLTDNSPAMNSGLQIGDEILKVNGSKVYTATDVSLSVKLSKGDDVSFLVKRNGLNEEITLKPELSERNGSEVYLVGFNYTPVTDPSIFQSIKQAFKETYSLVGQTYKSLKLIATGNVNIKTDVGGPITIIKISTSAAHNGLLALGYLLGFISINLAVFNLLPFPALDGGTAAILIIEMLTRRKIPDKIVGAINYVGFMFLMGLMFLVTLKDILFPVNL